MKFQSVAILGVIVASKSIKLEDRAPYLRSPFESHGDDVQTLAYEGKRLSARLNQVESPLNLEASKQHPKLGKKRQKHLTTSIRPTLAQDYNVYYAGSIYMGTELAQVSSVIFDTGGAWMVL